MSQSKIVEVKLELGHRAKCRDVPSLNGHTHDWMIFVKGAESVKLEYFVEKVVFWLHDSYENPKRVLKKPPYKVEQSGYAGFMVLIDIHFRNKEEPKMVRFQYDLFLHTESMPPVNHTRLEKLTFTHPTEDFKRKLLDGGGVQLNMEEDKSKKESVKMKPPQSNPQKSRVSKGKEPPKDRSKSSSKTDETKTKDSGKSSKSSSSSSSHKQSLQSKQKPHKSASKHPEQSSHKSEKRKSTAPDEEAATKKPKIVLEKHESSQSRSKDKKPKKAKAQPPSATSAGLFAKESSINIKDIKKPKTDKKDTPKELSKSSTSRKEKLQKFVKNENTKPPKQSKRSSKDKEVRHGSKSKSTASSERSDTPTHRKSKRRDSTSVSEDSSDSSSSSSSSSEDEQRPARKKKTRRSSSSDSDSDDNSRRKKKSKDTKHRSSMSKHSVSIKRPDAKEVKKEKALKLPETSNKPPSSDVREKSSSSSKDSKHKLKQKKKHSTKEGNQTVNIKIESSSKKIKTDDSKLNKTMPEFSSSKSSDLKDVPKVKKESLKSNKSKKRKSESSAKTNSSESGIKMTFKKPNRESLPSDLSASHEAIKKISAKLGKNKEKSSKSDSKPKKSETHERKVPNIIVKKEADPPKKVIKSKAAISDTSSSDSSNDDDDTLTPQTYHPPPEKPTKLTVKQEHWSEDKHVVKSPIPVISPASEDSEVSYSSAPSPISKHEEIHGKFSATQEDFEQLSENDSLLKTENLTAISPMPNDLLDIKPPLVHMQHDSEHSNSDNEMQTTETPFNREDYKSSKVEPAVREKYDADYYRKIMPPEGRYVTIENTTSGKTYPHITPQIFKELQELQRKVSELTSVSRLKKIMSIVQKSGLCQKNPDETFDFDLCALDQKTISKIQRMLKT